MTVGRFLNGEPLTLVALGDSIGIPFWMMMAADLLRPFLSLENWRLP